MRKLLFLIALTACAPSSAHEWYPMDCCGGLDCGPILNITMYPNGNRLITIKNGSGVEKTAVFPKNFPIRLSPDGKEHACIGYANLPICLYSNDQI
jgi:hypothetical protein